MLQLILPLKVKKTANKSLMFCLIAFLVGLVDMASDLYVPMLPAIGAAFKVSESWVGATISINLVSLGLSGLYYGKLSDRIGRRPVIIWGLIIFTIASFACGFSTNIVHLLVARFFQGIGGGVAFSVGVAVVRDLYTGTKAAEMFSRMQSVIVLSPALAPTIGGFIGYIFGWEIIFYILFVIATVLLIVTVIFGVETLPKNKRSKKQDVSLKDEYFYFFKRPLFLCFAGVQIATLGWFWSELGFLPQLFVCHYGVDASSFGMYLGVLMIAYFIGTCINQYLVHRFSLEKLVVFGLGTFFLSAGLLCLVQWYGALSPWLFVLLRFPSSIGLGVVFGNAGALAMEQEKKRSGSAAAFIGASELMAGAVCICIIDLFGAVSVYPLAVIMIICSFISVLLMLKANRLQKI
ncbi:MAG: multidrug effflux MFS transporter [Proteobacteria bacterium]|nr:multidrug effflux MFS transporter [Pseudomonadota bacterium]